MFSMIYFPCTGFLPLWFDQACLEKELNVKIQNSLQYTDETGTFFTDLERDDVVRIVSHF